MDVERQRRILFAAKTVVAAVVCALAYGGASRTLRVFAALCGAFATQFVAGRTRREQRVVFAGSSATLLALTAAATLLAGPPAHPIARSLFVALVAFAIFPARAVLPGKPAFPMFGFTAALLVTVLAPGQRVIDTVVAAGAGVLAAFVVHVGFARLVYVPRPAASTAADEWSRVRPEDLELGIRGAAATLLATLVAYALHLKRPYWVELAAVVLLAETWRESAKKSVERVGATVLGCGVGWLVHAALVGVPVLVPPAVFAAVFLAVYMRPASYAWMMFFLSVYVVLLFSIIGGWTLDMAFARVLDTAVGAAIAVAITATRLVRPLQRADARQ